MKKLVWIIALLVLSKTSFSTEAQFGYTASKARDTKTTILANIKGYLNSFRTLRANFKQISPEGVVWQGIFYLWRPGRMRISYQRFPELKEQAYEYRFLLAERGTIYDYNLEMEETTEIPVEATPASIILRQYIDFQDDISIKSLHMLKGTIALTLVNNSDPEAGSLTLVFNQQPLILLEWEITDNQGLCTRVIFDAIETGITLNPNLFKRSS